MNAAYSSNVGMAAPSLEINSPTYSSKSYPAASKSGYQMHGIFSYLQ